MSFVLALPLLLVFLFAVVDLGRTVFLNMALGDAAHAACRAVCASGSGSAAVEVAREAALAASPSLAAEGLWLQVSVDVGDREEESYAHRLYDAEARSFVERPSKVAHRDVRVELELKGAHLTPVGSLLAEAAGREGAGFSYASSATGERDATVEGGVW